MRKGSLLIIILVLLLSQFGGMSNTDSNPVLTNVVLSDNAASNGGGMYNSHSNPIVSNSIIWGNVIYVDLRIPLLSS